MKKFFLMICISLIISVTLCSCSIFNLHNDFDESEIQATFKFYGQEDAEYDNEYDYFASEDEYSKALNYSDTPQVFKYGVVLKNNSKYDIHDLRVIDKTQGLIKEDVFVDNTAYILGSGEELGSATQVYYCDKSKSEEEAYNDLKNGEVYVTFNVNHKKYMISGDWIKSEMPQ